MFIPLIVFLALSLIQQRLKEYETNIPEVSHSYNETITTYHDLVKVRIELRTDRSMEFVHLKDMRAAGFEPINVISTYKWQDGLGYY